jgi:hypothetical protein
MKPQEFAIRHAHRRGAATAEALILLTFFILVWTGVRYVGHLSAVRLRARAEVRHCAFYIATHGCEDVPDHCAASTESSGPSAAEKEDTAELTEKSEEAESSPFTEAVVDIMNTALGLDLFERAEAQVAASIDRPPLIGGETVDLGQSMSLPCNPVNKSLTDVLVGVLTDLLGITKD